MKLPGSLVLTFTNNYKGYPFKCYMELGTKTYSAYIARLWLVGTILVIVNIDLKRSFMINTTY